jgi:uncharacterized protein YceK
MKKLIITLLIFSYFLSGCSSLYLIDSKIGSEYVLLNELPLSEKEKVILHWKTTYDSPFVHFDPKSEKFYYLKNYDYSIILKK